MHVDMCPYKVANHVLKKKKRMFGAGESSNVTIFKY